ncbi:TIGR03668 family PPOX class F420-dependent oxidoreductase [Lapillicoccus sp.]|uniref:TIGR03668 family PPOX class F420-dependent oxidoreductase n=1 Tax=Lapillicoccus sp. TaxID=1909287 RepID=UPI003267677B
MTLDEPVCRARFATSPVARLATINSDGTPHLVPVTFAVLGDVIVVAVDHKPKTTTRLRRLRNISDNPAVCVIVDHYTDDWSALWWVRADARAEVVEAGDGWHTGVAALVAKYDQYQQDPPTGPVIRAVVTRWSGWAYTQSA